MCECSICLDDTHEASCTLSCGHKFHSGCIIQSALHDPRCPICRMEIAKKPRVASIEITMQDLNNEMDTQVEETRRLHRNYVARKRRFIRSRADLMREEAKSKDLRKKLVALDNALHRKWSEESNKLWMGSVFADMKKERSALLRNMRRHERIVERVVIDHMGEAPEIDDESEDEQLLYRSFAQIASRRTAEASQIVQASRDDNAGG